VGTGEPVGLKLPREIIRDLGIGRSYGDDRRRLTDFARADTMPQTYIGLTVAVGSAEHRHEVGAQTRIPAECNLERSVCCASGRKE
jgi:hypothetical protein